MAEFLHFIQFTVINYAFIFVLIVVTIDNLIPKLNLTVIFNSIRIFLIAFAVIYTLYLYYHLFFHEHRRGNFVEFVATFDVWKAVIFLPPFILLSKKMGLNKYVILGVAFLMNLNPWIFNITINQIMNPGVEESELSQYYFITVCIFLIIVNILLQLRNRENLVR